MGKRPRRRQAQPLPPEFMLSRDILKPQYYARREPATNQEQAFEADSRNPGPLLGK